MNWAWAAASEETKSIPGNGSSEQATEVESPGGSAQDDPGEELDDLSTNDTSASHKRNDPGTESSPSCGWRGVCYSFGVKPGR